MNNSIKFAIAAAIAIFVIVSSVTFSPSQQKIATGNESSNTTSHKSIRIGYFANINHAPAVIGLGRGDFQKALGDNVDVSTQIFNAGPSAIEALLAKQIDVAYVGPNPAINGYIVSHGESLRIISGVSSGGAVFVVRSDSGIESVKDFANKKFASPQLGNTQDVALRKYLLANGYETKENGGSVEVIPASNADILTQMITKKIDGAWVAEPWGAKLVHEAGGRIFLDERTLWPNGDFVTALIVVNTDYLKKNPDVIKKLLEANLNETDWINSHPDEAITQFNAELVKLTGKSIPSDEFKEGFARLRLTYDPIKSSLSQVADDAYKIGFLKTKPDLSNIYDLTLLNEVLVEKNLARIT